MYKYDFKIGKFWYYNQKDIPYIKKMIDFNLESPALKIGKRREINEKKLDKIFKSVENFAMSR